MRGIEFGAITGDWSDRPVALVACGPSMAGFDLERLRGLCRVIAIKEMVFEMPWADEGFGLDLTWISKQRRQAAIDTCRVPLVLAIPVDEGLTIDAPASRPGITYVVRKRGEMMSEDPKLIYSGGTSGFGAMNLPYLRKARDVFLFGYDYSTPAGRHHWDESRYPNSQKHGHWVGWSRKYNFIVEQIRAAGMRVTNVGMESALTAFPKVSHETALEMLQDMNAEVAA